MTHTLAALNQKRPVTLQAASIGINLLYVCVCLKTLCAHWAERLLSPLLRVDSSIGRFALERVRSIADGPCLHFEWMTANALRLEIVVVAIG